MFSWCLHLLLTVPTEAAPELRTSTATIVGLGANAFTALDALDPRILPALM
jgi:hypothetical protein